jgi:hypothetical protein
MKLVRPLMIVSSLLVAGQAQAATTVTPADIANQVAAVKQTAYTGLTQDLAAAAWMNPSNSAEPHSAGIIPVGVQAAIEIAGLEIDPNATHWSLMGITASTLPLPRLRLSVGIPFGLDVGYMKMAAGGLDLTGYEVRMAFGNYIPVPMLEANVRYHTSKLSVSDAADGIEVKNSGFAAMIGANLPIVKPYIEVGTVKSTSSGTGSFAGLTELDESKTTTALGAKVELAFFVINAELAKVGDKKLTNVKLGFEF